MKRIAIFCDGTWNTPDKLEEGKPCQTNVVKLAKALSSKSGEGIPQIMFYDPGIGTEGGLFKRVIDGATGNGISENILQAYRFLIKNYSPGDELFFFGFSRGAYTVRSLAGLIRNSGILKIDQLDKINRAYNIYQSRKPEHHPKEIESGLFKKTFAVEEHTQIKFIGVWDTAGALGNPLFLKRLSRRRNQFHDTKLSSRISHAYQALSIDEKRRNFKPTFWYQNPDTKDQILEQVWFSGVHSDVGGGYPLKQSGLSDKALKWMMGKAQNCGLKFDEININPQSVDKIHKSYRGFYKLLPPYNRKIGIPEPKKGEKKESVHLSVKEKYNNDSSYRPKNLVNYYNMLAQE
jgi:uncharacterized protein (DUF2235 family)